MFRIGDRVKLVNDFNNEPGIIPAGTMGVVRSFSTEYVVTEFDDVSDLEPHAQINNAEGGLFMFAHEIEKV